MSHHPIPTASGPSSNFQSIFDAALNNYKRKTKTDLLAHQLTAQFQDCDSPTAILDLLNRQYNIQRFTRSQNDSGSSKQWLNTTVTVLNASSRPLARVFSPAKVIFAGIAVFLLAAKDVGASQDASLTSSIELKTFWGVLKIYVEVQLTEAMKNLVVKIMAEILGILAIATKQAWLSPPDPSINYNAARDAHHHGSAAWFTNTPLPDWKVSGSESLLWIHGKPGSGKSILRCFLPNHQLEMSLLFFDFKDASKQDLRALQSSLLIQLSAQSNHRFKALSDLYSSHDDGKRQPSEDALTECLKSILVVLRQAPTYIIIDALDECPNVSKTIGVPAHVTSRPEFDIRSSLEQLAHFEVSLHDQVARGKILPNTSAQWSIRQVGDEEVETGTQRAAQVSMGRCQLETLRECLARNVERVLHGLPKSLDDTYERVLKGIAEENRDDVHRLTINFNGAEEIPKLNPDWRWEDQEEALQAACSSLIAIVDTGDSRVVQFSHFSVKEFLTSPRLADSSSNVSHIIFPWSLPHNPRAIPA
ncbi:hypothetical protein BGW80DRAFT_1466823 [Lactifluus volemus]|nr:hypothetical protein BGW80DRAFT_1466823 [Lactifluus volemus]